MADDAAKSPGTDQRRDYYQRIGSHHMAPLWETLHDIVPRQPNGPAVAHRWDYDGMVRPFLMEAGRLITARAFAPCPPPNPGLALSPMARLRRLAVSRSAQRVSSSTQDRSLQDTCAN
jgi:hypothetical protein